MRLNGRSGLRCVHRAGILLRGPGERPHPLTPSPTGEGEPELGRMCDSMFAV
jgi:hypothetical protein